MSDLQRAVELLKTDDKETARKLLVQVVKQEPNNEKAWFYLVACAATPAQREASIRQLLRLNPTNENYHQLAERYHIKYTKPLSKSAVPLQPRYAQPKNVKEAISHVDQVLKATPPPTRVRQKPLADEPEDEPIRVPAIVRRLWFWVAIAILIIVGIITVSVFDNEQQKRHVAYTITAEAALIQGSQIAVTNAAIVATVERSATRYWATEALYQATQQPIYIILQDEAAVGRQTFRRGEVVYVIVEGVLPDLLLAGRVSSNGVVLAAQESRSGVAPTQFAFDNLPVGELRLTIFLLGQPIVELPLIIER